MNGSAFVGADDGNSDGDFQDALVTSTIVSKEALIAAAPFLKSLGDD